MSVLILTYTSSTSTSVLLSYTGGGTVVTPLLLVNARLYQNFVSDASTITVNGLSPDTEYSFQWSIDEFVVSNLVSASTSVTPIPTPPVLSLGSIGTQSVSLPFSGAVGSTSYAVFVDSVEDTNAFVIDTTALLYGLSPSTTYDVQLEAMNLTGSAFSQHLSVTTSATPVPPSPLTIAFVSATDTTLTFSFTGGVGATSYVAFRNGFQVVSTNLSVVGSSFTISGLVASTSYLVQLQALNEAGSTDSNNQLVSTVATPLNPPTKPVITFVSATTSSLTFSFTGGVGATSYSATANGSEVDTIDLAVSPPTFTISGLAAGTSYSVVFTAVNVDGSTPSDPVTASTSSPPPVPPTSPLVIASSSIGSTDLYFTFTGGVGATSYSATTNGSAVPSGNLNVSTGSTPFFQITGLTPLTSYDVIFTATNSAGSVTSNTVTQSTGALIPPTKPVITFGSATETTLTFTYTGGVGATSYSATANGNPVAPGDLDTSTPGTFVISGLTAGTTYAVIFTATNTDGSTPSDPVDGTTSSTPSPLIPTLLVLTFLVSPSSGSYLIDSGTNLAIGNWDLVAGTITGATGGAASVISYLTGLQTSGCKILVSIGGATASLPLLFGGATQPTDLAHSIAYSLFGVSASPNPLGFQKTDWSTFVFDGIDYDIEANTPTASDLTTFHTAFKTQVPSSIVTAAPQSPNVKGATFTNGLTANGDYGIVSNVPTSTVIDLATEYNDTNYAAILNQSVLSTMDYIFIQCYNQTGWYYTSPDTQTFVNMLASFGYACLKASPVKCKIVIGLASADGTPIFDSATSSLLNSCIAQANDIIVTERGATTIAEWLDGVGMWNSPTNISAITSIYSNSTLSNLPANVTILYCNASGNTNAPGWVGGANVPIPESR